MDAISLNMFSSPQLVEAGGALSARAGAGRVLFLRRTKEGLIDTVLQIFSPALVSRG
jgi:hypothetical protein